MKRLKKILGMTFAFLLAFELFSVMSSVSLEPTKQIREMPVTSIENVNGETVVNCKYLSQDKKYTIDNIDNAGDTLIMEINYLDVRFHKPVVNSILYRQLRKLNPFIATRRYELGTKTEII